MLIEYPRIAAQIEPFIARPAGPTGMPGRICLSVPTRSEESGVEDSVLPPGQRDETGFWYPTGYSDPRTLVRPRRRRRKNDTEGPENKPAGETGSGRPGH
jgi:hypothetical protein